MLDINNYRGDGGSEGIECSDGGGGCISFGDGGSNGIAQRPEFKNNICFPQYTLDGGTQV